MKGEAAVSEERQLAVLVSQAVDGAIFMLGRGATVPFDLPAASRR